jgi:hypothetical protein
MLAGAEFLQQLRLSSPKTGVLIDSIIDGINNMAAHLGVDPTGKVDPPDPISSIQVQPGPDMAHVTLTDNSRSRKAPTTLSSTPSTAERLGMSRI